MNGDEQMTENPEISRIFDEWWAEFEKSRSRSSAPLDEAGAEDS